MKPTEEQMADAFDLCRRRALRQWGSSPWAEDMVQQSALGVLRAAEDWDPNRGAFGTYAWIWATSRCTRYWESNARHEKCRTHLTVRKPGRRQSLDQIVYDNGGSTIELHELIPDETAPGEADHELSSEAEHAKRLLWRAAVGLSKKMTTNRSKTLLADMVQCFLTEGEISLTDLARRHACSRQNVAQLRGRLFAAVDRLTGRQNRGRARNWEWRQG